MGKLLQQPPDSESVKKLARFRCQRCSRCCRQKGFVYLDPEEPNVMAAYLGLNPYDFVNQYCDLESRRYLVLKKKPDEVCIFLTSRGCEVYEARPSQCREFPLQWRTKRSVHYCEGLKKIKYRDKP